MRTEYTIDQPLVRLLRKLRQRPRYRHVFIQNKRLLMEIRNKPQGVGP